MAKLRFAQFGAGRIGGIHAKNAARNDNSELAYVIDVDQAAARKLADRYGAKVTDRESALSDSSIDAVIIASSTDTHADLIEAAARAGKAIFCEKPIDLSVARVDQALAVVDKTGVPFALGFNRRFDANFRALKRRLEGEEIGNIEIVNITSRDPAPPPIGYVKVSGGLYRDFMIHDLDMAMWLLAEDPSEIFAMGSCLVDPEVGKAGDIDTALVTIKTASGKLCLINNSRRATYGYDQRIEVHGAKGLLMAENLRATSVIMANESGYHRDPLLHFFLERYATAYEAELDAFIQAVQSGQKPEPSGAEGRKAQILADAATESFQLGRPVKVSFA